MIGRSQIKLEEKAKEIQSLNDKIQIKTIIFDFNQPYSKKEYQTIFDQLDPLDISLLINNVGYAYWFENDEFHNIKDELIDRIFQVNLIPTIHLSKYFLGRAIKREGKKSGLINVSSLSALIPGSRSEVYSGAKVFIDNFTKSLAATPIYKNVDIITLNTCSVASNINRGTLWLTLKPEDYTKQALDVLGDSVQDAGHFKHYLYTKLLFNPITCPFMIMDLMRKRDSLGAKEE